MSTISGSRSSDNNENEPIWLSEEYDNKHQKETASLLFGEGTLDLSDPVGQSSKATPESSFEGGIGGSNGDNAGNAGSAKKGVLSTFAEDVEKQDAEERGEATRKKQSKSKGKQGSNKTYGTLEDGDELGDDEKVTIVDRIFNRNGKEFKWHDEDRPRLSDAALAARPHVPSINPCLWMFHLLQGITVVASLCLITTQILPIIILPKNEILVKVGLLPIALKTYISLICVIFIIVETDLHVPIIKDSPVLQRFFSRGFVYSFVGLICVEEAYSERIRDIVNNGKDSFHISWVSIFMQISSWVFLGTGLSYMLLGLCCLKTLKDKLREKEIEAWKTYRREMKNWKDLYE